MLIPSIDLMGGKIVQLVQGERKALEFEDFDEWVARFSSYPLVQLIDLDAAMGNGNNRALVRGFAGRLPCQVGGGIRSLQAAEEMLRLARDVSPTIFQDAGPPCMRGPCPEGKLTCGKPRRPASKSIK